MTTRRNLLGTAAGVVALALMPVPGPGHVRAVCCAAGDAQPHELDCPAALTSICDDCGAEPGQRCHHACSGWWR